MSLVPGVYSLAGRRLPTNGEARQWGWLAHLYLRLVQVEVRIETADQRSTNRKHIASALSSSSDDHVSTLAAVPGGVGVNIGRGGVFLMRPGPDEEKDSSEDRGTWVLSGSIVDG
jgi:hypothetical protein